MKNNKTQNTNEGVIGAAKKFTNAFFDGLKSNAVNSAVKAAKKNKRVPSQVVQHMINIERASRELEQMIRDIE